MTKTRFALAATLVVALAAAGCGGGNGEEAATDTGTTTPPVGSTLQGSVGPGFEINLSTQDGQAVTTLAPGSYTLVVDDKASSHNFHLTGPGVDVRTDVGDEETESFPIDVQPGSYSFVCDVHPTINGDFEVSG